MKQQTLKPTAQRVIDAAVRLIDQWDPESLFALNEAVEAYKNETPADLFAPGPDRVGHNHPETSRRASRLSRPRRGSQRAKVLAIIVARGEEGANAAEIADLIGVSRNQVGAILLGLREDGWIQRDVNPAGTYRERPTDTRGNAGIVHIMTAAGRHHYRGES